MSKKTSKTTAKVTKFEKNAFYQNAKGDLWQCVTGKTRKAPDGNTVIDMRAAPTGEPTGEPVEEYVDTFVKKLTTKELKEWREVAKREAEALISRPSRPAVRLRLAAQIEPGPFASLRMTWPGSSSR